MMTFSPLRYPGGKGSLLGMMGDFLASNRLDGGHYAEPFAGGGGLALGLLFKGHVAEIHLNDIDLHIAALWRAMLFQPEELIETMMSTPVSIEEWHRQRTVYLERSATTDPLALAFSALFLNRTNRSGIIKGAGVIGGLRQNGNYLLDCRFNKADLAKRIRRVAKYRQRIHFTALDAVAFLAAKDEELPARSIFCIDPPYYKRGADLYTSFYRTGDHATLATQVLGLKHHWITTYDDCPEIEELYKSRRVYRTGIQYSVQTKRVGTELLIVSKGLKAPAALRAAQA